MDLSVKTSFHDLLHFFFIFASNFLTGPMTFLTNTMICFNYFFHFCYKIFHRTYGFPDKTTLLDKLQFFFIFVSNFLAGPMDLSVKHHFMICSTFFIFASNFLTGPMTLLTNTILMICFNSFFIFVTKFFTGPMAFLTKHHFLISSIFFHFGFKLFSRTYGPFCKTSFHDLLHFFHFCMKLFNRYDLTDKHFFDGLLQLFFHFCYKIFHRTYGFPDKTPLLDLLQFFSFLFQTF